jgi:hypothetical protein
MDKEKLGEESMEETGSLQTHHRRVKLETKEPKMVEGNIQGKQLQRKW